MKFSTWTANFRELYDKAFDYYRSGGTDPEEMFDTVQTGFLAGIGMTAQNLFDFAEDGVRYGQPDWETALLITSARRDFFFHIQRGVTSKKVITEPELPEKTATLDGIPWLPRIIKKAHAFLSGELTREIMFGCSGDRRFLAEYDIHPADFLRVVWASHGDDAKVLAFVRASKDGKLPEQS